jgi:uncharacterized protein (TIGR02284 family)
MSTDEQVTKDLISILEDGKDGFSKAADKLEGDDEPGLAAKFREYSRQREQFAGELRSIAGAYGDQIHENGSLAGAIHRGWLSLKDAVSGTDPKGVLEAAEQGEDHAVAAFDEALSADISANLRTVVTRQCAEIHAAHDDVRSLRNAYQ